MSLMNIGWILFAIFFTITAPFPIMFFWGWAVGSLAAWNFSIPSGVMMLGEIPISMFAMWISGLAWSSIAIFGMLKDKLKDFGRINKPIKIPEI